MAEEDNPVLFEDARREHQDEVEEEGEEPFYAPEAPEDLDRSDLEEEVEELRSFLSVSPPELREIGRRPTQTIEERRDVVIGPLNFKLDGFREGIEGLKDQLENATETNDFLNIIAQAAIQIDEQLNVLTSTQIDSLSALFDIVGAVEPFSRITVSGTNDIDDVDTAEPVVPDSDEVSIFTRILFVKSSDSNTDTIAIGDDETQPDNGWVLDPGENLVLSIDLRDETLWMASETSGVTVELLGLR